MKTKRTIIIISAFIIGTLLLASCGIDKKCPAYTKADTSLQKTMA